MSASVVRVTLEGDFTWEGLQRLQAQLDGLKNRLRAEGDNEAPPLDPIEEEHSKLELDEREALKVQITFVKDVFDKGGNAWRFLEGAYRLSQGGQSFSLTELAQRMDVTHGQVLAYNRNIGRTAKKWTQLLNVLEQTQQGRYHLANAVFAAVRVVLGESRS